MRRILSNNYVSQYVFFCYLIGIEASACAQLLLRFAYALLCFVYFRWSWSWSCYFGLGLGLTNLVLFTSLNAVISDYSMIYYVHVHSLEM